MQSFDDVMGSEDAGSPSGRVQDIRRQWALHEDEAFAHKLQDEEIHQHYAGNRNRNAIVREDAPRAREEQRKEEQEALENRLRHLSLLQRQAEEDAQIAQKLAQKYESQSQTSLSSQESHTDIARTEELFKNPSKCEVPLLGASACLPSTSNSKLRKNPSSSCSEEFADEEELRQLQEKQDAELARQVQELEQYEKDKILAIEAQDRELAKMLYEKEKARIKRAKERARQKAEAAAMNPSESSAEEPPASPLIRPSSITQLTETTSKRVSDTGRGRHHTPPRVPEKNKEGLLGFKANPKKLPPNPHSPNAATTRTQSEDPIPPYMPMHGHRTNSSSNRPH